MIQPVYAIEIRSYGEPEWRTHAEYATPGPDLVADFDQQLDLWSHLNDYRIVKIEREILDPRQVRDHARYL